MNGEFCITEKAKDKPSGKDTVTSTIRVERKLLAQYDELAAKSQRSRNELICLAMEYALEHLVFIPNDQ